MNSDFHDWSPLPLKNINHISLVCSNLALSLKFYRDILGFVEVKRPASFKAAGHWLLYNGIGLHIIEGQPISRPSKIDPRADHFSFECEKVDLVIKMLQRMKMPYHAREVSDSGITVSQVFFHDPDHNMIEVCDCERFPIIHFDQNERKSPRGETDFDSKPSA